MLGRAIIGAATLLIALGAMSPSATADDNDCPPGTYFNGRACVEEQPPDDDNDENEDDDDTPPGTGCAQNDPLISPAPCHIAGFTYNSEQDRYLRSLEPAENEQHRPPDGELSHLGYWTGPPDEGHMYEWRKLAGVPGRVHWSQYGYMWLPDGSGEPPPVDLEEVAETILDGMDFEPVEIGLAPRPLEQDPDSIGVVGAPVWMWVANEGPTTWGPLEESATVGGITVTVTASVDDVVWNMGDGGSTTCGTPGQAYRETFGVRDSPSCGYMYEHTSRDQPDTAYAVSATTNWSAEWSASTGASGNLEVEPLTSTVHARIGERQAIEVG